jgi:RimJ/RimL family protein N-acetyltransferase
LAASVADDNGQMNELLTTKILTIRPATLPDKKKIFNWLANSDLTSEMLGPPNFSDNPIPTWDEFDNDYLDYFFDGSQPMKGRCFVLEHNGLEIGQINYNEIDTNTKSTEIDIWLSERQFTGKGLGTEAIKALCNYLDKSFDCKTIYIAPSKRNSIAIKSYKKAGFMETDQLPMNFIADYNDTIVLMKIQKQ